MEHNKEHLIKEWEVEENAGFDGDVAYASHMKIWWKCEQGHKWQSALCDRMLKDAGCPFCTNRKVLVGFNDLSHTNPELVKEWHPTKNGALTPEMITAGSEKKVWWQCELGHEWQAIVENRTLKGHICPYCSGKKAWPGFNDLATLYPELEKEWNYEINVEIDPTRIRPGCAKKVWWHCGEGHDWEAYIFSRTSQKRPGCPVCAGNAKPSKVSQWMVKAEELRAYYSKEAESA